jgi:hypothetical protein
MSKFPAYLAANNAGPTQRENECCNRAKLSLLRLWLKTTASSRQDPVGGDRDAIGRPDLLTTTCNDDRNNASSQALRDQRATTPAVSHVPERQASSGSLSGKRLDAVGNRIGDVFFGDDPTICDGRPRKLVFVTTAMAAARRDMRRTTSNTTSLSRASVKARCATSARRTLA